MFGNVTPAVKQLLILNVAIYVLSIFMPQNYDTLAMYFFENQKFKIWQPLTHMFMHAQMPNFWHLVLNMFALVSFGCAIEHFWGAKRFVIFYLLCGLGAAAVQMGYNYYEYYTIVSQLQTNISPEDLSVILNTNMVDGDMLKREILYNNAKAIFEKYPSLSQDDFALLFNANRTIMTSCVGASGAIYGLLVAFAFMFPQAELMMLFIPFPVKAKYFVPILILLDLFSGVTGYSLFGGGGIAHFAHVGGALAGFLCMLLWRNKKYNFNRWN
jgi:membrane associated rhomboid family serine protease